MTHNRKTNGWRCCSSLQADAYRSKWVSPLSAFFQLSQCFDSSEWCTPLIKWIALSVSVQDILRLEFFFFFFCRYQLRRLISKMVWLRWALRDHQSSLRTSHSLPSSLGRTDTGEYFQNKNWPQIGNFQTSLWGPSGGRNRDGKCHHIE